MMSARSDYLMEYLKSCKGFTTPPGRETTLPKVGDAIEVRLNVFADADAERWRPAVVRENYSHDGCFSDECSGGRGCCGASRLHTTVVVLPRGTGHNLAFRARRGRGSWRRRGTT